MVIAARINSTLIAVLVGLVLGIGLLFTPGYAYASKAGNKIAKTAASFSYTRQCYQSDGYTGTKAYFAACKKLGTYYTKNKKQMQCNVPVAAAVRLSGVDPKFPTGNSEMYYYMKKSDDWECLGNFNTDESTLQPGDILIRIAGVTKYHSKYGGIKKAETNHACVYIGKKIVKSTYKNKLKGTDADVGRPWSVRTFVSAHTSKNQPSKRSAACLEKRKQAFADYRLIVFRHK